MKLFKTTVITVLTIALLGTSSGWINAADTSKEKTPSASDTKKTTAKKDVLDINTATANELKQLPGINDAQVKKIIESRPYNRKIELVQKQIISQAAFDKIKDKIAARKPSTEKKSS